MHRPIQHLGIATLTVFLTGWFCISPVLVLCTCADGHSAFALKGHEEPACGQHADHADHAGHTHSHDHQAPDNKDSGQSNDHQNHQDDQNPFGVLLTSNSFQSVTFLSPLCIDVMDAFEIEAATLAVIDLSNRIHGPPTNVRASISSTILLI